MLIFNRTDANEDENEDENEGDEAFDSGDADDDGTDTDESEGTNWSRLSGDDDEELSSSSPANEDEDDDDDEFGMPPAPDAAEFTLYSNKKGRPLHHAYSEDDDNTVCYVEEVTLEREQQIS